jgi:hypothetical protein
MPEFNPHDNTIESEFSPSCQDAIDTLTSRMELDMDTLLSPTLDNEHLNPVERYIQAIKFSDAFDNQVYLERWGSVDINIDLEKDNATPRDALCGLLITTAAMKIEIPFIEEGEEKSMRLEDLVLDIYPELEKELEEVNKKLDFAIKNPRDFIKLIEKKGGASNLKGKLREILPTVACALSLLITSYAIKPEKVSNRDPIQQKSNSLTDTAEVYSETSILQPPLIQTPIAREDLANDENAYSKIPEDISEEVDATEEELSVSEAFSQIANSYIATDPKKAVEISRIIRSYDMADSSNVCGPLAAAILLGWELQSDGTFSQPQYQQLSSIRMEGIEPNNMWLGTPETTTLRFQAAFPPEEYDHWHITESIRDLDFSNIAGLGELEVGDFLYLDGGMFTHYLTVTKKDDEGRIYTVTNFPNAEGDFIIDEVMLWDPETEDGFFRILSTGIGPENKYTGTKGFYLWRRRAPAEKLYTDPLWQNTRDWLIEEFRNKQEGEWNVQIHDLENGKMFEWREGLPYHSASTIKVPIAVLTIRTLKQQYPDRDLFEIIESESFGGRSFEKLLQAMVIHSEDPVAELLGKYVNDNFGGINNQLRALGMEQTSFYPRRTTQRDMLNFWTELYEGELLNEAETEFLLTLLNEYTPNDDLLIGGLKRYFPEEDITIYNKRGAIVKEVRTIQDNSIVVINTPTGTRTFYIGIAGTSEPGHEIGYEEIAEYIDVIINKLGEYLSLTIKTDKLEYKRRPPSNLYIR